MKSLQFEDIMGKALTTDDKLSESSNRRTWTFLGSEEIVRQKKALIPGVLRTAAVCVRERAMEEENSAPSRPWPVRDSGKRN